MVIVRAPVRISFGGGGTDLEAYYRPFGGFVISTAITRYCYVMANASSDGGIHISSADYHTWQSCPRGKELEVEPPLTLPKVAVAWFVEHGWLPSGIELFLAAEVPPGTGLGSSSAMAVALVSALATYAGLSLSALEIAELACTLEIERLQMPIGKQDQYASAVGGVNALTFTAHGVSVTPLTLPADVICSLSSRLLLFWTGQNRDSAEILGQQRADTQKQPGTRESLHHIKSLALDMQQALQAGDLDRFGHLLDLGWHEKKRLSTKISSSEIDRWYKAARQAGAIGGKITGAGGGGFLLLYCPQVCQQGVRATLSRFGLQEIAFDFDVLGVQVLANLTEPEHRLSAPLYHDS